MSLLACHECRGQLSSTATSCPHCGAKRSALSRPVSEGLPWWAWSCVGVLCLFIAFLVLGAMTPTDDPKKLARSAVQLCWKEQARKSLDPDTQRFIAGSCEKMERDFEAKYLTKP